MSLCLAFSPAEEIVRRLDYCLLGTAVSQFASGDCSERISFCSLFSFSSFEEDNELTDDDVDTLEIRYKEEPGFAEAFVRCLAIKYGFNVEKIYPLEDFLI